MYICIYVYVYIYIYIYIYVCVKIYIYIHVKNLDSPARFSPRGFKAMDLDVARRLHAQQVCKADGGLFHGIRWDFM